MAYAAPPPSINLPVTMCDAPERPFQDPTPVFCPNEIYSKFQNTVVTLRAVPKFSGGRGTEALGLNGIFSNAPVTLFNGFFIKNGYIVSSTAFLSSFVQALAVENMNSCETAQECPPADPPAPLVPGDLPLPSAVAAAILADEDGALNLMSYFDFFVDIYNVNQCKASFPYKAFLAGADLASGTAVFRIERCDAWNKCLPQINEIDALAFGSNVIYGSGTPAYVIGNWMGVGPVSISAGTVTDSSYIDPQGIITYEAITTDIEAGVGVTGSPILNKCGQVIGMATGLSTNGTVVGVSSSFMRRIIDEIICTLDDSDRKDSRAVYSPLLGFLVYQYGWFGFNYSTDVASAILAALSPSDPLAAPPLPLSVVCQSSRKLVGAVVTAVSPDIQYCGSDDDEDVVLAPGDIVVSVGRAPNYIDLGSLPGQLSPNNLAYQLGEGCRVDIKFRSAAELYNQDHCSCLTLLNALEWLETPPTPVATLTDIINFFYNIAPQLERSFLLNAASRSSSVVFYTTLGQPLIAATLREKYDFEEPITFTPAVRYLFLFDISSGLTVNAWNSILAAANSNTPVLPVLAP